MRSLTHIAFEQTIRTKHIIQNPVSFEIYEKFSDYIPKHKKIYSNLVIYYFKLFFDKILTPHTKSD